jgi:hypothetical protein
VKRNLVTGWVGDGAGLDGWHAASAQKRRRLSTEGTKLGRCIGILREVEIACQ